MMKRFLFRFFVTAISVLFVAKLLPGIEVTNLLSLFLAALILGIFNALLRPLMIIITLPFTVLTFGLFIFVINGLLLYLTSFLVGGFEITSFWVAVIASILISIISGIINWLARV
jgi:putative membrane protein